MTRYLKVDALAQAVACPACRQETALEEIPHEMNFTTGTVRFRCRFCHREVGRLGFARWNALQRRKTDSTGIHNPAAPPAPDSGTAPEGRD